MRLGIPAKRIDVSVPQVSHIPPMMDKTRVFVTSLMYCSGEKTATYLSQLINVRLRKEAPVQNKAIVRYAIHTPQSSNPDRAKEALPVLLTLNKLQLLFFLHFLRIIESKK